MATCINLRERFGGKYRLKRDQAYYAEHGPHGRAEEPWLWVVLGRFADLFPWGGQSLGISTHGRGARANQLKALPYVTVVQVAEDGFTLRFDIEHFAEVAKLAGLRRKRRLSDALLAGGRKTRFTGATAVNAQKSSANATGCPGATEVPGPSDSSDLAATREKQESVSPVVAPRARVALEAGTLDSKAGASASDALAI